MTATQYLPRGEGRIAYDVAGAADGPLVLCVPGMGDLRSTYRHLVPALLDAGCRVATLDLRGHGDSDATFSAYDDEALAGDVAAVVHTLGGPAVIVGNSMGAGAAVIVAAAEPDLVAGLALLGPFVRNPPTSALTRLAMRVLMAPLWARVAWGTYLPKLYAGHRPDDFEAHRTAMLAAMRRPGAAHGFSQTTRTSHDAAQAATSRVTAPTVVVMGALDPDFADPAAEAAWLAGSLAGPAEVVLVPDCGHYPQSQQPGRSGAAVLALVERVARRA